ncbi:hypothetical protein ACFW2Y_14465 [Streptomyces sp. NPDC058877]|uniref:hypothetical protein n=1 Tax=Streptomyces sp. NPDC058877 TaxID=3346665 RepID=UPI0036BA5379
MTTSNSLFHYTSAPCWDEIRKSGFIAPTSQAADHMYGRRKHVWLTDSSPEATGLRDTNRVIIRISVAPIASALYWPLWSELCSNREAVEAAGGDAATWYVSDQPIAVEHWGQVIRMDTGDVLLNPDVAPAHVSAWGTMPNPPRIAEAVRRLDQLRPQDGFRALRIDAQISRLRNMADLGETEQRQRAAWRTLKSEIAAFQAQC